MLATAEAFTGFLFISSSALINQNLFQLQPHHGEKKHSNEIKNQVCGQPKEDARNCFQWGGLFCQQVSKIIHCIGDSFHRHETVLISLQITILLEFNLEDIPKMCFVLLIVNIQHFVALNSRTIYVQVFLNKIKTLIFIQALCRVQQHSCSKQLTRIPGDSICKSQTISVWQKLKYQHVLSCRPFL